MTWIRIYYPESVNLRRIIFSHAHICLEHRVALKTLKLFECLQRKDVEAAAGRYNQSRMLYLEKYDGFIELKTGEDFRVFLLHDGELFGAKVGCLFIHFAAHNEENLFVCLHELHSFVIDLSYFLKLA